MKAIRERIITFGNHIRILVVDDSVVIRRLVEHALEEDPTLEVVGTAANGSIALAKIPQVNPDVITLDIEMPEMDGLETLRRIRQEYPQLRVIMFSTLTERGAAVTLQALTLGADDYVTKAANAGSLDRSMASLRMQLIPKIKQFFGLDTDSGSRLEVPPVNSGIPRAPSPRESLWSPKVVAVGVSTGGPAALAAIVPQFPSTFHLPILIVQHMPPLFTRFLAERLQGSTQLKVEEATQGSLLEPGKVMIAPGDYHMRIRRKNPGTFVTLDQSPPENSCRPAVDVLFRSVSDVYGGDAILVVLTGMGQDGLRGVETLKSRSAYVIAQDETSSVVWGMPRAVVDAGLADCVLPLEDIVPEILRQVNKKR